MSAPWHLHASFNQACERNDVAPLVRGPRLIAGVQRRRRAARCPQNSAELAAELDRCVDNVVRERRLPTGSTGGSPPMLWCLGGPQLFRNPEPQVIAADSCVDLNIYVCAEHRVLSADLWPFDLAGWSAGRDVERDGWADPVEVGADWAAARDRFIQLLGAMLDDVFVEPAKSGPNDGRGR